MEEEYGSKYVRFFQIYLTNSLSGKDIETTDIKSFVGAYGYDLVLFEETDFFNFMFFEMQERRMIKNKTVYICHDENKIIDLFLCDIDDKLFEEIYCNFDFS